MSNKNICFIVIPFILLCTSCKIFEKESKDKEVFGCTDETAQNYDPDATKDDGSCDYCIGEAGEPFLLLTYDGGQTWEKKCFDIPVGVIWDISITDSNNIWVCTSPRWYGGNVIYDRAQILHSDNGGYTWEVQYDDTENNDFFNYIEMFDSNNGIAMGDGKDYYPLFLKTTDGGITWTKTTTQRLGLSTDTWRKVDFVDVNIGYYKGSLDNGLGELYRTTNSGTTWSNIEYPDSTNVWVLKFFNEDIGLMSVGHDELLRTIDGGQTWESQEIDWRGTWALDIVFHPTNPNYIWMGTQKIYFSDDMGLTWTEQVSENDGIHTWNMYVGNNSVWVANHHEDEGIFVNRDINSSNWEEILLPLDDNKMLEGIIDGVGDNVIVLPGYYR